MVPRALYATGRCRIDRKCFTETGYGLIKLPFEVKGDAEVTICFGRIRIMLEGFLIADYRFVNSPLSLSKYIPRLL